MENALQLEDFSLDDDVHIDRFIQDQLLVQKVDVILNDVKLTSGIKTRLVILCYNLTIDGEFIANSCDLVVFCRNVIAKNGAVINVSGSNAKQNAEKKISRAGKNGDNPDGSHADNLDPLNNPYDILGEDAGTVTLHAEKIIGSLKIVANGGNGGKGQDGDEGVNGRDGLSFPHYLGYKFVEIANQYVPPKLGLGAGHFYVYTGEDGLPAGNNGDGALGGRAGNGGGINISIEKVECIIENNGGVGGPGGYGGKADTIGGKKGECTPWESFKGRVGFLHSGFISVTEYAEKLAGDENYYYSEFSAKDRSTEHGKIGIDGEKGKDGTPGVYSDKVDYLSLVNYLPSSYFRILLLEAEFFYINGQYNNAELLLQWLLRIYEYVTTVAVKKFTSSKLSPYLDDEFTGDFNSIFSKAAIYYNQLSQNLDFFGNTTNYVHLLEAEFLGDKISELYPVISKFKEYINEVLSRDHKTSAIEKTSRLLIDNNAITISELAIQNTRSSEKLSDLNNEILKRQNEVSSFKKRILDKELKFKSAIEHAKAGCNLAGALMTITKLVSVAVTISSGIGATGSAVSVLSDFPTLLSDFSKLAGEKKPGLDLDSWNDIFNDGGDASILKRVKNLQEKGKDFKDSVAVISNFIKQADSETKNDEIVAIRFNPDNTNSFNKEEFVDQMKIFVKDFPTALEYQAEVLSFMDYCDITNQKRVELTSVFLSIMQNVYRIDSLQVVNTKLYVDKLLIDQTKTPYGLKVLFLDSYVNAKLLLLKLLYLQNKALSYFTLEKSAFSSKFYKKDIDAYAADGIVQNKKILIDNLVGEGFGRTLERTIQPIKLTDTKYPISFQSFIDGDENGVHKLLFTIEPMSSVLADYKEVFVQKIKISIDSITTKGGNLIVKIKHMGNACFIKADTNKSINFSHNPVKMKISYKISDNQSPFVSVTGDYLIGGKKPYVELSPFASWELVIEEGETNTINEGLSVKDVKAINLDFEFYHRAD